MVYTQNYNWAYCFSYSISVDMNSAIINSHSQTFVFINYYHKIFSTLHLSFFTELLRLFSPNSTGFVLFLICILFQRFILFSHFQGQKMDDMTRILPSNCSKVFIQRDFSDGTAVKFQTKFPAELDGKVKCSAKG